MNETLKYVLLGFLLLAVAFLIIFILSLFGVVTVNAEGAGVIMLLM